MLKFTSMTIVNFGPYEGEQTIDFGNGDGVTIIWGDNGHGKTTLLNLFRYALFGQFQYRHESVDDILKLVNKEGIKAGKYDFKVILNMLYDGKKYELTRQYNVRQGVTIPTQNGDYEKDVFLNVDGKYFPNPEHELALIMPEEVSRFFLFDGELMQEYEELIKDETSVGEIIKKSIESILGVPILTNAENDTSSVLKEYSDAYTKAAQADSQTQKLASQIEAANANKEEQLQQLENLRKLEEEEQNLKMKLEDEGKKNERLKLLIYDKENLENDIALKEVDRDKRLQDIVTQTKDIWKYMIGKRMSEILRQVKSKLSELQQKHNTHIVENQLMTYIQHIIENHHCECCDQDVDEAHVNALKKRLEDSQGEFGGLSPEENKLMGILQAQQADLENMQSTTDAQALKIYEIQLDDIIVKIDDAKNKLKDLLDEISRYGNVNDLTNATKENAHNLQKCYQKIQAHKEGIKETNEKIKTIDEGLANLYEKMRRAGVSNAELKLAEKKVEICKALRQLFQKGIIKYRDKLKTNVERDATKLFCKISSDPEYRALRINNNYGLFIEHSTGEIVPFRSAGYEHIVALSLIGALHQNAPLRGPIIMDSPFGRLDANHKERVVKELPSMSDQIILLAYTNEIDSQTARNALGGRLKKEYRLRKYSSFHTEIELQYGGDCNE